MKVLLIGDSCTDKYVYGNDIRLSPEAPVPVLDYVRSISTEGMAWNVFNLSLIHISEPTRRS